jgi:hypothetical protein
VKPTKKNQIYKRKLIELYDGLDMIDENESNTLRLKLQKRDQFKNKEICSYDGKASSIHTLFQTLVSISRNDNMDTMWYIGKAFAMCHYHVRFSKIKKSLTQKLIEDLIIKYHDKFRLIHKHFYLGLKDLVPHLFNNRGIIRTKAQKFSARLIEKEKKKEISLYKLTSMNYQTPKSVREANDKSFDLLKRKLKF